MTRRLSSFALCVAVLLVAGPARAVPESLLRNSPFMPAGNVAPVQSAQAGRLELRGIATIDGKTRFTIFDTSNSRAVWLAVGESDGGTRVAAYDAAAEAVTVELEGQSQRLTMKEAEIINVVVALPSTAANPMTGQPGGAGVNPATPGNEQEIQERRNQIIEGLRRRRALRAAGAAQPQPPPTPSR